MNEQRRRSDKRRTFAGAGIGYWLMLGLTFFSSPFVLKAYDFIGERIQHITDIERRLLILEQWRLEHEREIADKKSNRDRESDSLARRVDALESSVNVKTGDRFTGSDAANMRTELQRQLDSHDSRISRMECAHMNCGRKP